MQHVHTFFRVLLFFEAFLIFTETPTASAAVKWHPGHYLFITKPYDGYTQEGASLAVNNVNFKGVQLRYFWRQLETNQGYQLSHLGGWLDYMQSHNKHIALLAMLQTYDSSPQCVPDYMLTDPIYEGGQYLYHGIQNGQEVITRCTPKFWVPAVTDRVIALETAISQAFDSHPALEIFNRAELAVNPISDDQSYLNHGGNNGVLNEATRELGVINGNLFKHTSVLVGANWVSNDRFFKKTEEGGNGIWGPDVIIRTDNPKILTGQDSRTQQNMPTMYPFFPIYRPRIPLGIADQGPDKRFAPHYPDYITMDDIWGFIITDPTLLYVNYTFWTPYASFFKNVELPYINAHNGQIVNTACPQSIITHKGGCDTSSGGGGGGDTTAPTLAVVTPVPSVTRDNTPNLTFSSTESGTVAYTGDCSSNTTAVTNGNNTITFSTLARGTHSNCALRVTDAAGNQSSSLTLASFLITYTSDLNKDRSVNGLDFNLLHTNYGTNSSAGDVNQDGIVNILDFGLLRSEYGRVI